MSHLRQGGREAGREIELGGQSSETQQGCEQLNIERLFGAVMMSQAREERRGKKGVKEKLQGSGSSRCYGSIVSHGLALSLFHLKTYTKSYVLDITETDCSSLLLPILISV